MAETASPDRSELAVESIDLKTESDKAMELRDRIDLAETKTIEPKTNGHADSDATGLVNGESHHQGVNGGNHDDENDNAEPPAKRQRTRDVTPSPNTRKPKPESPPWRRMDADGPTSYTENGRRKSGRINTVPIEHQPQGRKRLTRGSLPVSQNNTPKKDEYFTSTKQTKTPIRTPSSRQVRRPSASHTAPNSSSKSSSKKSAPAPRSSTRSRHRTPSPPPQHTRQSSRPTRSARQAERETTAPVKDFSNQSPRIKLRVGRSGDIPLVHPGQVRKRPKIGTSFEDFWERAGDIAVEEGGLQASEDGPVYTDELAQRDARLILRIEDEAEPGGILAPGRCSLFAPDVEDEVPRQWARQDHMIKAVTNFRKLLLAEQQRHRSIAKKLAEACRDEYIRRQPKSAEQLEAEARELCIARYRQVVKAMAGTWENVRLYVNRQRVEEWEAAEQKRVKAALNEAVSLSEQKLQARQAGLDSEIPSDADGFDDLSDDLSDSAGGGDSDLASNESSDDNDSDEDSDVMSSSSDDEDGDDLKDAADEGLTQEQLRLKYANIPELEKESEAKHAADGASQQVGADTTDAGAQTSDDSVDMDDDLGSSDMGSDDDEDESDNGDDEENDDSEGEPNGLLGLFFGKSELQQIKQETGSDAPAGDNRDEQMPDAPNDIETKTETAVTKASAEADDDEMSLIQHPDSINGEVNLDEIISTEARSKPSQPSFTEKAPTADDTAKEATVNIASDEIQASTVEDQEAVSSTSPKPSDPMQIDSEVAELEDRDEAMGDIPMDKNEQMAAATSGTDDQSDQHPAQTSQPTATATTRPLELDAASSLEVAVANKEAEKRSESPSKPGTHKIEIPSLLRGTLREYQRDGLDWLAGLYANNTNGILADEMGLGKTIQTIALLAHLACQHEVWGPHLVVVPTSVMLNWEMEFKKWCPGFKILAYYGSQDERKRKRQGWNNDDVWNVCITSYQLVLQDQQVFKRRRWHYLILDEAHNIKNFKSQRWQTLLGFNTHSRLLLTGTPLQNNLTELWSLLFFLMPSQNGEGGFADLQEFHDWFHKPESQILESGRDQMDDEAKAIISKLHKVLRPYLLRRLKADVEKQMPGKYEHVEFCRLSKRQRELYDGFLSRSDTRDTFASGNYLSIINCLMQLRKVCNHPDLFVDRPIMTSWRMRSSVPADFDITEKRVQRLLVDDSAMANVNLSFLNLVPTAHERLSTFMAERVSQLSSHRTLMEMRDSQHARAQVAYVNLDPSTVESNVAYLESAARWGRFEELQHCVYLNALRRQQKPIFGKNLIEMLNIDAHRRPYRPRPKVPRLIMSWFEEESSLINSLTPTLDQRADNFKTTIEKFTCVTPAVITRDLDQILLGRKAVNAFTDEDLKLSQPVRWAPFLPKEAPPDPWHEARMRHTIQFPDKRLLQYDCGKLQALDKLLRRLQSGGHRALIFTQMTKVLDILEQFLNIHGHKYLRLDGATKVEQRQILTDRFNHDPRILCFILSTRSGGLGINLTGADTVIFYDQDWNPAMDKQCQDRCHRIGQTRDVHIYRLVSEHTIEANILRKASQKQMLDDVVIQEGEFTTDYFNKVSVRDVLGEKLDLMSEGVAAADAALDRVLGGPETSQDQRTVGRVFEQAEDTEDVAAARIAEREIQADEADFTEKASGPASGTSTARQGTPMGGPGAEQDALFGAELDAGEVGHNAWGESMGTVDQFMLAFMTEALRYTKLELPKDKKKSKKKGKDTRKR